MLKSIATGEYRAELAKSDMIAEGGPVDTPVSDEQLAENSPEDVPAGETEPTSADASGETEAKSE
jgi:hypothetical protein